MVHRSTHLRIPLFGERGHSLLDLEAVARHIIMRQHLVPEVGISVSEQCLEEVAVAHITGCQPVVMRMNIIYQMLENLLAILGWNHAQHQRNGIGSLTSRTVIYLFYSILYLCIRRRFPRRCSLLNMQEFLLESLQDFRSQDGIAVGFSCLSAHCRSLLCQFYPQIIMGCSYQRHRGILREARTAFSVIIPVTQTLFQYTATVLTLKIIHIAEHLRCIFLHHPVVAVMLQIKERKRYQGTAPLW